jgi:hypothetical protein
MEDDDPVPDNIEGQEQIEYMGWVEYSRLERGKKRNTGRVIWVPQRHLERFYEANPEVTRWYKKSRKIALYEYI